MVGRTLTHGVNTAQADTHCNIVTYKYMIIDVHVNCCSQVGQAVNDTTTTTTFTARE